MRVKFLTVLVAIGLSAASVAVWGAECADCIALNLNPSPNSSTARDLSFESLRSKLSPTHSLFVLSALEGALSSLTESGELPGVIAIALKRRSDSDPSEVNVKARRFAIHAQDLALRTSPLFEIAQIGHDDEKGDVGFNGAVFRFSLNRNQLRAFP
jgi:hypothetical protein